MTTRSYHYTGHSNTAYYFQSARNTAGTSCATTGVSAIGPLVTPTMTPSSVPATPVTGGNVYTVSLANLDAVLNCLTFEGGHPLKKSVMSSLARHDYLRIHRIFWGLYGLPWRRRVRKALDLGSGQF